MLTRAVLGKTNEYHDMWNGILRSGLMYLNRDPTDTRKNHMLRPQSQRPTKVERSLMMTAVVCVFSPRKPSDGKMSFDMSPS